jgi:hypothetical protein
LVAHSPSPKDGVLWDVIRSDFRAFCGQLPELLSNDCSAAMLVFANIVPVIEMFWRGDPFGPIW